MAYWAPTLKQAHGNEENYAWNFALDENWMKDIVNG